MHTITDATPTDFFVGVSSAASLNDAYMLIFVVAIFIIGILTKSYFRKMYINLKGGRKDD